jgi:hypothetical protein
VSVNWALPCPGKSREALSLLKMTPGIHDESKRRAKSPPLSLALFSLT